MRTSTIIYLVLILGIITISFGIYGSELNKAYPNENQINTTFENDYDFSTEVQSKTEDLKAYIENTQDADNGWFTRIASGIIAIPWAVIVFFNIAFFSMTTLLSGFFAPIATYFKVDPRLILFVVVLGGAAIVFLLVEWWKGGGVKA